MSVEIIAEIAQGYEGDVSQALLLARGAVRAGADAVKFQLVIADEIAVPDYQYYDLFRTLEMSQVNWQSVADVVKQAEKLLYFDVFGEQSLSHAIQLGAHGVKIHTTDFLNTYLIQKALESMPRVLISLGGVSVNELARFIDFYNVVPGRDVCFMYGFQAEPTPLAENHLRRLRAFIEHFPGHHFGFMDHSEGCSDESLFLALVTLGYEIDCIEKHISLDSTLQLEDYISALDPNGFRIFSERVRTVESALGSDCLDVTPQELAYRQKAMKVVVSNRNLSKGLRLKNTDVVLKRVGQPSENLSLHKLEQVIGRELNRDLEPHQQILEDMLK